MPTRNESFRWYWLVWAVLSLVTFLVPELWVFTHRRTDLTLSDSLRSVLGIEPRKPWRWVALPIFLLLNLGMALLGFHILAGWPS